MTDRQQAEKREDRRRGVDGAPADKGFIDGAHGTHGGGLESEGRPQEKQPESALPSEKRDRAGVGSRAHDEPTPER